ncbi:DUF882 domain-containing protein [Coralliovum pocilloporae]|uniref:DUF882 domain-containing protein n=1 Tax=Coralliovum pocilloporae TaxID=3066369 RepID=UPI0033079324
MAGRLHIAASLCLFFLLAITQAGPAAAADRSLYLYNTHTKETARITYKRNGRFDPSGLQKMNRFLRDWRRNESTKMDPRLFDLIWEVYRESGARKPIHVVSGYRSPATNKLLKKRGRGVARKSQHILGKAMDFYLPDVPVSKLRRIGLTKQVGGVGYYPRSASPFVHMDTGRVRHWPRMTRRQLAKVFPSGRTLHIPSDGKPLSGYKLALADSKKRKSSTPTVRQQQRPTNGRDRSVPTPVAGPERSGSGGLLASLFSSKSPAETTRPDNQQTIARNRAPGAVFETGQTTVKLPSAPPVPTANPNRLIALAPKVAEPPAQPEQPELQNPVIASLGQQRPVQLPEQEPTVLARATLPAPPAGLSVEPPAPLLATGQNTASSPISAEIPAPPSETSAASASAFRLASVNENTPPAPIQDNTFLSGIPAPELSPQITTAYAPDIPLPQAKPLITAGLPDVDPYAGERGLAQDEVTTADLRGNETETPVPPAEPEAKPRQVAALDPNIVLPQPRPAIETQFAVPTPRNQVRSAPVLTASSDPLAQLSSRYNTRVISSLMNTEVTTRSVYFSALGNADPNGLSGLMDSPQRIVEDRFRKGGQTRLRTHQFAGASVVGLRVLAYNSTR